MILLSTVSFVIVYGGWGKERTEDEMRPGEDRSFEHTD